MFHFKNSMKMINANEIRKQREQEFKETFDFAAFDKYLEDYFVRDRKNQLYIGLELRTNLTRLKPEYRSKCNDLAFNPNGNEYIWYTKIQISQDVQPYVEKYLQENGFSLSYKRACPHDTNDVMIVSL